MASLTDIEIRESSATYSNQRGWWFHTTGHHVRCLLLHFLPKGFDLSGSSKLSVIYGPRPDGEELRGTALGVTWYYIEDFRVADYMALHPETQQEIILKTLCDALTSLSDPSLHGIISDAAQAVSSNHYAAEIEITKLSRSTSDRQFRIRIYRCLGRQIGEVWQARVFNSRNMEVLRASLTDETDWLDRRDLFSRSSWSGTRYEIRSRLDQVVYNIDVSNL
jgi:hypothetical protein